MPCPSSHRPHCPALPAIPSVARDDLEEVARGLGGAQGLHRCLGAITAFHSARGLSPRVHLVAPLPGVAVARVRFARGARRLLDTIGQGLLRGDVVCPDAADAAGCAAWALGYLEIALEERRRGILDDAVRVRWRAMSVVAGCEPIFPHDSLGAQTLRQALPELARDLFASSLADALREGEDVRFSRGMRCGGRRPARGSSPRASDRRLRP